MHLIFSELKRRLKQESKAKEKEAKELAQKSESAQKAAPAAELDQDENIDANV